MNEAWEEEQMSNLGCESVSDLIAEVKRLRKELKEVEDIIQYALDRVGNDDDAKRVFEDFLEVIE